MVITGPNFLSEARKLVEAEINPVSAEHSGSTRDLKSNTAGNAVDNNWDTNSGTSPDEFGKAWMKIFLEKDKNYCVQKVVWYNQSFDQSLATWTCNKMDCSQCSGDKCNSFALTVVTVSETNPTNLPSLPCKYGDTVKLESIVAVEFAVDEIVVTGKQGKRIFKQDLVWITNKVTRGEILQILCYHK